MHRKGSKWIYRELNIPDFLKSTVEYCIYKMKGEEGWRWGRGFEGLLMLSLMLILLPFIFSLSLSLYIYIFKEKEHCDDTIFLVTMPSVSAIPFVTLTTIIIYRSTHSFIGPHHTICCELVWVGVVILFTMKVNTY